MLTPNRIAAHARSLARDPRRAFRVGLTHFLFKPGFQRLCHRIGGPGLLARLATLTVAPPRPEAGGARVLVLDRLYFSKDVDELEARGRNAYLRLDTHILSLAQMLWLPERLTEQVQYRPRTRPEDEPAWRRCTGYAEAILDRLARSHGIDAILASNVDYWQHHAFRRAARARGLPFLVLCQEVQTIPFTYAWSVDLYRKADYRFDGTAVAVFEPRTAEMLVESGVCTPDQVHVTGAPRLDPWLAGAFDRGPAGRDCLTLLAFDGEQYFAPRAYLEALAEFARASEKGRGSGLRYVLKCKDAEDLARARGHLGGVEHDLVLTHDWPLPDLLARSRLVMGYNSLALIEALLCDAELAVPAWGDAARPADQQNVHPAIDGADRCFRFLSSPADWRAALAAAAAGPGPGAGADHAARRALFRRWFHVPGTGSATAAVEAFIDAHAATPGGRAQPPRDAGARREAAR